MARILDFLAPCESQQTHIYLPIVTRETD